MVRKLSKTRPASRQQVQLIGGRWRRSNIQFADQEGLRPTPARVRETLFNWLQYDINGASVLDLFAGSGVLGMEALSRGAAHVTFVDLAPVAIDLVRTNLARLGAARDEYTCEVADGPRWLASAPDFPLDILFLDPPFASDLLQQTLDVLKVQDRVRQGSLVYLESGLAPGQLDLPEGWVLKKQKQAGAVHYCLCEVIRIRTV